MTIDALAIWQSEWALLPKVSDDSWKTNMASYIAARLDGKLSLSGYLPPTGVSFIFNTAVFISSLSGVTSGTGDGVSKIAQGFKAAAETPGSLIVAPGTAVGSASPATTFSVVSSSVLSGSAAEAKIAELASAPLVDSAADSDFPVKLHAAALLLTATVSGLNSVAPTPSPLIDAGRAVV